MASRWARILVVAIVGLVLSLAEGQGQEASRLGRSALLFGEVTVAPIRDIAEWSGAELDWQPPTVAITKGDKRIELSIGDKTARINGETIQLATEPRVVNGTAYAPLRFLAEAFGLRVEFDEPSSEVVLHADAQTVRLTVELGNIPKWWPRGVPATLDNVKDMEGREILDLIARKKLEVKTEGSGIRTVGVKVRRLVNHRIRVRIPGGTFFVSSRESSQNMVTTGEASVVLDNDRWVSVDVSAACANRLRDIPGSEDKFEIQQSPNQEELARLLPALRRANVDFAVQQAAIWIVTDDADYDDLGMLVRRPAFQVFGGERTIKEYEVAKAMKICDRSGIDITKKAIWQDRDRILQGLRDKDLKKWLLERASK